MIETDVYYPTDAKRFRKNLEERWFRFADMIGHYNSKESMSARTDKVLIYHVINSTVFVNKPEDDNGRVNITGLVGNTDTAKLLLEEISGVKLFKK